MTTIESPTGTYVQAIRVDDMFADPTYQRELDTNRARSMSHTWDPRLVGVLDVSDRGEGSPNSPRYAIINGQHRWRAATFVDPMSYLVCNVHTGLTVDQEAQLFWDIDRKTKKLNVWDKWYARRAAGDQVVTSCDAIAQAAGLTITHNPRPDALQCFAAIEFVHDVCDPEALRQVLDLVGDVWPGDIAARKAIVIKGLGMLLWDHCDDIDTGHLADALSEITASQLIARAKDLQTSSGGSLHRCITTAAIQAYNRQVGRTGKLQTAS